VVAVDTNVLVRLLIGDDAAQCKASEALFQSSDIYISNTVLLETEWVLRGAFDLSRAEVCVAMRGVLGLPNVSVADGLLVAQVIDWHEAGFDFADAFHLALGRDQEALRTFDTDLIKLAKKLTDHRVERP